MKPPVSPGPGDKFLSAREIANTHADALASLTELQNDDLAIVWAEKGSPLQGKHAEPFSRMELIEMCDFILAARLNHGYVSPTKDDKKLADAIVAEYERAFTARISQHLTRSAS